jgi:hypothetical protein
MAPKGKDAGLDGSMNPVINGGRVTSPALAAKLGLVVGELYPWAVVFPRP